MKNYIATLFIACAMMASFAQSKKKDKKAPSKTEVSTMSLKGNAKIADLYALPSVW